VNLVGIDAQEIDRGSVLTVPNVLETTTIFDAVVDWLDEKHTSRVRQTLRLYVGCVEATTDVRLISHLVGKRTLTRISSRAPLLLLPGDRLILRNAELTIGGGEVLDPFPPIRVNRERTSERLKGLLNGSDAARLRLLVEESTQGKKISNLIRLTGWTPSKITQVAEIDGQLALCEAEKRVISLSWLEQKHVQIRMWLEHFHREHPVSPNAPMHLLRSSLMSGIEPSLCDFILSGIAEVVVSADGVRLKSHVSNIPREERQIREKLERTFLNAGFEAPRITEILTGSGQDVKRVREQLDALLKENKLVRIAPDVVVHAEAIAKLKNILSTRKGVRFLVTDFKDWASVSRKYAIPLLEYCDRQQMTKREGDVRTIS
jgi:selenocysteine-specific elongation factor